MKQLRYPTATPRLSVSLGPRPARLRRLAGTLTVLASALFAACGDDPVEPPVATTITVTPASAAFSAQGETAQFTATVLDQNGAAMAGAPVSWSSSDNAVATVSSTGLVTAAGNGAATITAASGGASGSASVTVAQVPASITVIPTSVTLSTIGETAQLAAEVEDANGHAIAGAAVAWSSSDDAVATVDASGLVTATGNGEAAITATAGNLSAVATATVTQVAASVTVTPTSVMFSAIGETAQLAAEVQDANGNAVAGATVEWSSSDGAVATVDATGLVTATGNGEATITAASGELSAMATAAVMQEAATLAVTPDSVTLMAIGATAQLAAEAQDANGNAVAGATFAWSSSNEAVATVDSMGLVTATGNGEATITAASGVLSGMAAVTVMQEAATLAVMPDSVTLMAIGEQWQLTAQASDANGNAVTDAMIVWSSSDVAVATVDSAGLVTAVADGRTTVTASIDTLSASVTVSVAAQAAPEMGPLAPAHSADSVISLFSDAYDDVTVDTWSAPWDVANVTDVELAGNPAKVYTSLTFAGIEFTSETVDASNMTHFRMDIWSPFAEFGSFRVKLVDFGADGAFGGGDDTEHEVSLDRNDGIAGGEWIHLDLPLANFGGLLSTANLAQLIISGDAPVVYVDNVYFRAGEAPPPTDMPSEPAPTPQHAADSVISLFSDAYNDVVVDTWSAPWDVASLEDLTIMGDSVKKYSGLVFAGIEFTSSTVDATEMAHFRMDIWTPDETADPAVFRVKLVDFGPDGVWSPGVDDTEHELAISAADGLATGEWVQLNLPLADFTNLAGREHLAQLIISGDLGTVYVDNVYFLAGEAPPPPPPTPAVPAPTPQDAADDVISLFSDAYNDVTVDTWSAEWDNADLEDVTIQGNATKKYSGLGFAGIEFTSSTVDATEMAHFRMDIWTPDETADPAVFRVKLVDFGPDGVWSPGVDDTEHELAISAADGLATGEWVQLNLPLADFTNLAGREHLAQLIISGDLGTVYVDNVYFRAGELPTMPAVPAPTPQDAADDVISLFSDAYDDVTVDTWSAPWDVGDLADVTIQGNATKEYTNLVFAGIEFTSSTVDATEMTHFRMDIWTPDATADPAAFRVKLVDFGADGVWSGGDDTEHEISLTASSDPPLSTRQWVSYDIPLTDFTNLAAREHLAQLIISGDLGTVYVDNVYFRTAPPTEPREAAPTPVHSADSVISLFSDAYADVTVDTWSAGWDQADVADVTVQGNAAKKYTNLTFAGIEFTSSTINATQMTHFHMDIWTPDATAAPAAFRIKLVDFGDDGVWSGGDDTEHEIALTASSDPPLSTGQWVSYDIPLTAFTNLAARGHLAQLIISGDPNTVFVDNVYLHN